MAMSGATLAAAVKSTLASQGFTFAVDAPNTRFIDALCSAIVTHIQTNAVISVPSVSGVTPGGGVSGPGVGTIS